MLCYRILTRKRDENLIGVVFKVFLPMIESVLSYYANCVTFRSLFEKIFQGKIVALSLAMCEPSTQVAIHRSNQNNDAARVNLQGVSGFVVHASPTSWRRIRHMKAYVLDMSCTYEGPEALCVCVWRDDHSHSVLI